MSTVNQVLLVPAALLTGSDAVYYTAPANVTAKIGRAIFCNTTGSPATLTAAVTAGVAIAAGNTFISARVVAAGETYVSPELAGAVIPAGSTLRAFSGTASAITMSVSGMAIQ